MKILVSTAIIMIYFMFHWHYWLIKLLGGYMINTLLPIMILFYGFVGRELISGDSMGRIRRRKVFYLLIPLSIYALFASVSIFINEEGFYNIRRYFIYIYSPIIIFVSILGMYLFKKNRNIKSMLNILCIFGVVFSVYAVIVLYITQGIIDMGPLETNRGIWDTYAGGYGVGEVGVSQRFAIPGMTAIEAGPMMALLVFVSIYLGKNCIGRRGKYLYFSAALFLGFCVVMTVSRGSILSLTAGIIYLIKCKWFKPISILFIIGIALSTFYSFARVSVYRLIITFAIFFPMDLSFISDTAQGLTEDPRFMYWDEVLSYLYQHPFFGMGMQNFLELLGYFKMHSNYIVVPTAFGVPAGIFYITFITFLFIMVHSRMKKLTANQSEKNLGIVLGAGLVAIIVYLCGGPTDFHFIWVWFGLAAAWLRNSENEFLQKQTVL